MKRLLLVFSLVLAMALPALAADSTSLFNEKVLGTKIEKASGGGGVPVGTVIAWPSNSNPEDPENWLECNGQGISHSVYPELYAVVGGAVPDYRGLFLRGTGGNAADIGQYQGDAIRNIYGSFPISHNSVAWAPTSGNLFKVTGGAVQANSQHTNNVGANMTFDASEVVPTANENRPANTSVRYLIRALP